MPVLVISGGGRGVGKTAVGCSLMAALPELRWMAIKATPHEHGVVEGLWEEHDLSSEKDTGRYLSAGAKRAFLMGGTTDHKASELVAAARKASVCDAVLIESNRISASTVADPGEAALTLAVLSGAEAEWKASLAECVGRADALVMSNGPEAEELRSPVADKPAYRLVRGRWSEPGLVAFVRERLLR